MNYNNKKSLIIPSIICFLAALLICVKFSFPISWDVFYHIHMAKLYQANGLIFWDYLTVAPVGRLIMYPPLIHLFMAFISNITTLNVVSVTRFLQPFFGFFMITSITCSSYLLTDKRCAFFTGILSLLCFVTFNRAVITTPATLAISFFMLCCSLYFRAFNNKNMKYLLMSAVFFGIIANLHMATFIITCGVIALYSLIMIVQRRISYKFLGVFMLVALPIALIWWAYVELKYGLFFKSTGGSFLFIGEFLVKYFGIIPSILLLYGTYQLIKDRSETSLFILVWMLSIIALSQCPLIGINTISIRILEVAAYPMIIVAGFGFSKLYDMIKDEKNRRIITLILICYASVTCMVYADSYTPDIIDDSQNSTQILPDIIHEIVDPVGYFLKPSIISSRYGDVSLAHSRYQVMDWFLNNSNGSLCVCEDSIMDTIIVSTSNTPVIYGGFTESIPDYVTDPIHIVGGYSTASEIHDLDIGYILLDHNTTTPVYCDVVYLNEHYKICTIKEGY